MDKINELIETLNLENHLTIEEMPDLDLYMDQIIQIFESKFSSSKRDEDEKILTKTMINNYAKGKLFFPIKNKKYSKEHLILISLIYQMKGALSIKDIKVALNKVNEKITEDDFNIDNLYNSYLYLSEQNRGRFVEDIQESANEVSRQVSLLEDKDSNYLEQLLLVASLVNMSNYYRRAAEKIIDEIGNKKETT
ncbi:DUF1836 domain-containing protein [Ornithinibacillus sp. L9]|uniref:DUF1836 domain-containing protein n=1 Tax=Ornithinibacillus caprae TaxID=2678566 RepID=A0A6N8FIG7_9BACI|nr:DUF1836 domain-containing protein [Ornithinibacillus caprae]MUK89223.1 DUF1836 domain-containing protein [Ornithinibacillus caprae]